MPLRIFRSRNVSGANVVQALVVAGMFGTFFLGSLYLQRVLGYDALEIGLAFLPTTIVMGTLSVRYSEPLITRFGARTTLLPGLALTAAALALFTQAPVDGNYAQHVLPVMILLGIGAGLVIPGADDAGDVGRHAGRRRASRPASSTPRRRSAARSAWRCSRRSRRRTATASPADGETAAAALTGGYHLAFAIGAGLVLVALAVAMIVLEPEQRAAEHAAPRKLRAEPAYSEA